MCLQAARTRRIRLPFLPELEAELLEAERLGLGQLRVTLGNHLADARAAAPTTLAHRVAAAGLLGCAASGPLAELCAARAASAKPPPPAAGRGERDQQQQAAGNQTNDGAATESGFTVVNRDWTGSYLVVAYCVAVWCEQFFDNIL